MGETKYKAMSFIVSLKYEMRKGTKNNTNYWFL